MQKLTIKGRLPGLNEYIDACRRNPFHGAKMKKDAEEAVFWSAKTTIRGKIPTPCRMRYTWYEANKKRDMDNVSSFGRKVIQDALVKGKYLPGDGWAYIVGFSDDFQVDRKNPRIEVTFEKIKQEENKK